SFQPAAITDKQVQSNSAVNASIALGLLTKNGNLLELSPKVKGRKSSAEFLKEALDARVLGTKEVEPYLSLFYSYMLGLNEKAYGRKREDWPLGFNRDVFENRPQANQFNPTKLTGLHRWLAYMGLGWYDQNKEFHCNPYSRIRRCLSVIFSDTKKLECVDFLSALAEHCPELDQGKIFLEANKNYDGSAKECTLGLSDALVDLHSNGFLKLHCPKDSDGWSIALASPPSDGKTLLSNRVSQVELGKAGGK
ncbi:MAG: hypothetical protein CMJ82_05230, partial [Planctomycetaceae bacterium]|nr:hypothetical protein [Planctomycetaceae bacterium]